MVSHSLGGGGGDGGGGGGSGGGAVAAVGGGGGCAFAFVLAVVVVVVGGSLCLSCCSCCSCRTVACVVPAGTNRMTNPPCYDRGAAWDTAAASLPAKNRKISVPGFLTPESPR